MNLRAGRHAVAALLCTLLAGVAACHRDDPAPRAVVLIVVDTLRHDRLGYAGYAPARTPHLDALAARGLHFTRARTPVPVTLPAVSSLLTGRYPQRHGVRDNDHYVLPEREQTLAERFREAGWRTGAVVASAVLAADRGLTQGFETYDDAFAPPYPVYDPRLEPFAEEFAGNRRRADVVTQRALDLVRSFAGERYFLLVHYFDVHAYYDPPPAYAAAHPSRPYDGEISYVDSEIGRLLQGLDAEDGVLTVVVSDHGEGLGDHGEPEHGFLLYDSTVRVPWVVAGPGVPRGTASSVEVSLVDVAPTVARATGLPGGGPPVDGSALDLRAPEPGSRSLYLETMRPLVSYHWSELRGVVQARKKLIAGGGQHEVYDLEQDPGETRPLPGAHPGMIAELDRWTAAETRVEVLAALAGEPDPERRELLESLGYVGELSGTADPTRPYPHPREELPRWLLRQKDKARYRNAMTFAAQGRHAEAIALFDTLLAETPDRPDLFYNRGLTRRGAGDEPGFVQDMERALALDPDYVPALERRAEREGTPDDWRRILSLDEANIGALRALSRHHLEHEEPEAALPYLRRLSNALPDDAVTRFNLGLAALRAGRQDESRRNLELFLRLAPDDPRAPAVRHLLREAGGG